MEFTLAGSIKLVIVAEPQTSWFTESKPLDSKDFHSLTWIISFAELKKKDAEFKFYHSDSTDETSFELIPDELMYGKRRVFHPEEWSYKTYRIAYFGKKRYTKVAWAGRGEFAITGLLAFGDTYPATDRFRTFGRNHEIDLKDSE